MMMKFRPIGHLFKESKIDAAKINYITYVRTLLVHIQTQIKDVVDTMNC